MIWSPYFLCNVIYECVFSFFDDNSFLTTLAKRSDFFYYGKTWSGKNANGKILSFELPTAMFISYFLINLRNNIARRYRKMFPITMNTFCHFQFCRNRRNHLWKQCRSSLLLSLCKVLNWPKVRLQSWAWSSLALFGISTKIFSRLQWYDLGCHTFCSITYFWSRKYGLWQLTTMFDQPK